MAGGQHPRRVIGDGLLREAIDLPTPACCPNGRVPPECDLVFGEAVAIQNGCGAGLVDKDMHVWREPASRGLLADLLNVAWPALLTHGRSRLGCDVCGYIGGIGLLVGRGSRSALCSRYENSTGELRRVITGTNLRYSDPASWELR